MDIHGKLDLLGDLTPQQFMRDYWHKRPLLIRQAIPGFRAPVGRADLFRLAGREEVESRLLLQLPGNKSARQSGPRPNTRKSASWQLSHGPFHRQALPPLSREQWTLLVQGVDTHVDAVHELLTQFRFVPDARLDDLMISFATKGGGVGPHFDSYDVFLLQAHGQRRWRIGRTPDTRLIDGVPLKILANFEPEEEYVLDPGDMLYLPPRYAHDGIALNECMTYSIGFRSPQRNRLGLELVQTWLDESADDEEQASSSRPVNALYRDPQQVAVASPAQVPPALQLFADKAFKRALQGSADVPRLLGENLTEPKASTVFLQGDGLAPGQGVKLNRGTRMMYDHKYVFINGESYRAAGRDARLMRKLADQRTLSAADMDKATEDAWALVADWCEAGWAHGDRA